MSSIKCWIINIPIFMLMLIMNVESLLFTVTRIEEKIHKDKKKNNQDDVCYNVVSSSGSGERLTIKLSKSKEEKRGNIMLKNTVCPTL